MTTQETFVVESRFWVGGDYQASSYFFCGESNNKRIIIKIIIIIKLIFLLAGFSLRERKLKKI